MSSPTRTTVGTLRPPPPSQQLCSPAYITRPARDSYTMLGEQTIPISSLHSGGILEDADQAYALAELKSLIVFKTSEIVTWSQAPASTVAFTDHMRHIFALYEKYNAISVDAPLEELIDGLPNLDELEDSLQEKELLRVDEDVTDPDAIPGRYAAGKYLPRVDKTLLIVDKPPTAEKGADLSVGDEEASNRTPGWVSTISEKLGLKSLPDRISNEVSTRFLQRSSFVPAVFGCIGKRQT